MTAPYTLYDLELNENFDANSIPHDDVSPDGTFSVLRTAIDARRMTAHHYSLDIEKIEIHDANRMTVDPYARI